MSFVSLYDSFFWFFYFSFHSNLLVFAVICFLVLVVILFPSYYKTVYIIRSHPQPFFGLSGILAAVKFSFTQKFQQISVSSRNLSGIQMLNSKRMVSYYLKCRCPNQPSLYLCSVPNYFLPNVIFPSCLIDTVQEVFKEMDKIRGSIICKR